VYNTLSILFESSCRQTSQPRTHQALSQTSPLSPPPTSQIINIRPNPLSMIHFLHRLFLISLLIISHLAHQQPAIAPIAAIAS